ncbi:unnamed protein product [Urochloa decumbens]|uniref:F-box domain-containing protein n=1 Tax=Urochloa decumbens TaxID=240449 RepID=A0ABC8WV74_9POAL
MEPSPPRPGSRGRIGKATHLLWLVDELIEEVLFRFSPDDPALLFRAALVCKRWRRLVSDPGFRRRFREFHRSPPTLGILCKTVAARFTHTRFYRTSPSCPPIRDRRDWDVLDSRHGRVLMANALDKLVVWDPITEDQQELAPLPRHAGCAPNGSLAALCAGALCTNGSLAVLCAGAAGGGSCDHLDCHRNPFLVVFVGNDSEVMFSCVYSSEDGTWRSEPTVAAHHPHDRLEMSSSAFAGNALYFLFLRRSKILKYDLGTREMSVIHLPPGSDGVYGELALMTMEDNSSLGFARREGYTLNLWSMEADPNGAMRWTQSRVIEHETLLPVDALSIPPYVVAFAEGMIFMKTCDGLFSIDLKSLQSKNVLCNDYGIQKVFPYISFYAPGESGASWAR